MSANLFSVRFLFLALGTFLGVAFGFLYSGSVAQAQEDKPVATVRLSPVVAEQRSPGWLLLEQGKNLYQQGNYGEALRKFLLAKNLAPYTPEADYQIGLIFDADNDLNLAISELTEALDQKEFFYDHNDIYDLYMTMANLYFRQKNFYQYEASLLKTISMELPATTVSLRKGKQILTMLTNKGIDAVLYYYNDSFSNIIPALNELSLYYYQKTYYNDTLQLGLYSIISTLSQGITYLKDQQYISYIPQDTNELYQVNPEYIIDKLSDDLHTAGINYVLQWDLNDLSLKDPKNQIASVIAKIQEVDPDYQFSLLGYYLNTFEKYPVTQDLLYKNKLYRQLYFVGSALSIQGYMQSANNILNVLRYLPQSGGQWSIRAKSQLRQSFIDKQVPVGSYFPN